MSDYKALYQKFRPQKFSELFGQQDKATPLREAVKNGRLHHAYLFHGPRGCGKTSTALILAKAANCEDLQNGEPCNKCASCVDINNGVSHNVFAYDAATNSSVDQIRELTRTAGLSVPGKRKIIIIDETHGLSTSAQNALLTTLETPPPGVTFILTTTEPERLLGTVSSRCLKYEFRLVPPKGMREFLLPILAQSGMGVDPTSKEGQILIDHSITQGKGSLRDTISALEGSVGLLEAQPNYPVKVLEALAGFNTVKVLEAVAESTMAGVNPRGLTNDLFHLLRDCFFVQMSATNALTTVDWGTREQVAKALGAKATVRAFEFLGVAIEGMQSGGDARVLLEVALCRICAMGRN